jgi:hypothetical protein
MPEDPEYMDEWEELEYDRDINDIYEFLDLHADEEKMYSYFPTNGTLKGFAFYITTRI